MAMGITSVQLEDNNSDLVLKPMFLINGLFTLSWL